MSSAPTLAGASTGVWRSLYVESGFDVVVIRGTEVGLPHRGRREGALEQVRVHRSPQRGAVVRGCRLDEEIVDQPRPQDRPIRLRVEGNPTRKAHRPTTGAMDRIPDHVHHRLLACVLDREGDSPMAVFEFALWSPSRTQEPLDRRHVLRVVTQKCAGVHVVWLRHEVDQTRQIDTRLTVRREPHHLPFIAVLLEAEVVRHLRVEQPE